MKKAIYWMAGIFFGTVLVCSLLMNAVVVLGWLSKPKTQRAVTYSFSEKLMRGEAKSKEKIAVIYLEGIINYATPGAVARTQVDDVIAQLEQAHDDEQVKAIVLFIDSPGGEVAASDTLYQTIRALDKKKPVVAYINSVGASGAYYAALGARSMMAHELSLTGSVGVIIQTLNVEKLSGMVGVQVNTFKSGEMKDLLSPTRPITEQERLLVQGLVDETYDKFLGIVAERRSLDKEELRKTYADGRILSGKGALQAQLIDSVGLFDDALEVARSIAKLPKDAQVVRYEAPINFRALARLLGQQHLGVQINVPLISQHLGLKSGTPYYLSNHLLFSARELDR